MANIFYQNGGQPQKQPKYTPIFQDRMFTGLFTQRNVLHDPSDVQTLKYGGRPDALWSGRNVELTNRLTLQRRPGLSTFSLATYPTAPNRTFSFPLANGTIQVMVDTMSTGSLALTSVAASTGTFPDATAVYTGVITGGANNALAGMVFTVTGFNGANNNGTFVCTASTATTITLDNAIATNELIGSPASVISAGAVYLDNQDGTKTLIFAKSFGAGQTYFAAVAGILYMGDGVDTRKYTPGNPNGLVWNWGIVAPASQPSLTVVESSASAVSWVANTVFSTMGLLVDGQGNIELLISVNATTTNATQFGTTGNGEPAWNQTPGGTTIDGGVTWTNWGPVPVWKLLTLYENAATGGNSATPSQIYDPTTKTVQLNINAGPSQGTSGNTKPPFKAIQGSTLHDPAGQGSPPGVKWFSMFPAPSKWQPSHGYTAFLGVDTANTAIIEPTGLPMLDDAHPVYMQICTSPGTSGASGTEPPFPPLGTVGQTTTDGDLIWQSLGRATRVSGAPYGQWAGPGTPFSAIALGGRFYVCTKTGVSAGSAPSFAGTAYGDTVTDGSVTWTDVGPTMAWATSTQWYLPLTGFAPPTNSQPYGGASIVDSNANLQSVTTSGKSGAVVPVWGAAGTTTPDNAAVWFNEGVAIIGSLVWKNSLVYAYSFKARALDDFYSTIDPNTGNLPIAPGYTGGSLPSPTGSLTEAVSTASPVNASLTSGNTGAVVTLSGFGSTDPQVDTIIIWRSTDGGGSGQMFELTEIPAPPPINGAAQPWSFLDFLPELPTADFPGLNIGIPAPIDNANDPPFPTYLPMVYNFTRIWGGDGSFAVFSGGPDTRVGNPNEAFPPVNAMPFLAPVIRLVKTPQGLVTFLTDSIEVIGGGPSTTTFFSVTWAPGIGLQSYNALDVLAGEMYFFSADNQFRIMTPSLNVANAGFALGDQFANLPSSGVSDTTWNSANVYVASHQNGIDNCVLVCDGLTGWYRLNPRQAGANPNTEPVWSPFATITNGCNMVQSIETAPGIKKLLVGATDGAVNQSILYRDLTVYTDNGTQYGAYFVMGSILLCYPGEIAILKFLEADFKGVDYQPTISYLLNELSGSFTPFTALPVFDPPSLYGGRNVVPSTYSPLRYYFLGNASLARARHMQIKVDLGTTAVGNEIFNLTIFGRVMIET